VYQLAFHAGVALTCSTTIERTAELARRLFRQCGTGARIEAPRLVVLGGPDMGRSLDIPAPPSRLVIGRAESCQLVLADPQVSREHAELFRDLDGVLIRNLSAKNGVAINDQLISQRRLRDGDELAVGGTRLLFEDPAEEPMEVLMTEADHQLPARAAAEHDSTPAPAKASSVAPPPATSSVPPPKPRPALRATDLLVYGLAALVILLSIAGLVALLREM
jgi:hypothetical protein